MKNYKTFHFSLFTFHSRRRRADCQSSKVNRQKSIVAREGFTLIEILIAVSIIAVLASIIIAAANGARESAKIAKAKAMARQIRTAISMLEGDTGQWPGHKTIEEVEGGAGGNEIWDLNAPLAGLTATDGNFPNWNGPYISSIPLDPWGNNYFFDTDYDVDPGSGTTWAAAVGSFGPNGQGRNVYDSDNIFLILKSE